MSNTITIKLKRSVIGCTEKQKATIRGLGLKRINHTKTLENTPAVRGMIKAMIQWLEIVK
ncbi:MAG: 50S ribosomal protein L30 [Candidatus Caldatribacteriota bacterium]